MTTSPSVLAVGFSASQTVLFSPLIRRLWRDADISCCSQYPELLIALEGCDVVFCNGNLAPSLLDRALSSAFDIGVPLSVCVYAGTPRPDSLECAKRHLVDVILADLEREDEIPDCARALAQERRYWSKGIFAKPRLGHKCFESCYARLSVRERVVYAGLVAGRKHGVIARELGVTVSTVNTYCSRIFRKFGVSSATELLITVNKRC